MNSFLSQPERTCHLTKAGFYRLTNARAAIVLIFFIFLLNISCNNPEYQTAHGGATKLVSIALNSPLLQNLGILPGSLESSAREGIYSNGTENSIILRFRDNSPRFVLFTFDNNRLKDVVKFGISSSITSDLNDIENIMKGKMFTGSITIESITRPTVVFNFKNSLLDNVEIPNSTSTRTQVCGYWASEGGNNIFSCSGREFRDYDWAQRLICGWSFIGCMAGNIYNCYRKGCPYY